jgi:DNA-directed RNA polymerase subunit D
MSLIVSQIKEDEIYIRWSLNATDCQVANKFRRIIEEEVPTAAIDRVEVFTNTSMFKDEYLAHRLSLIPVKFNGTSINEAYFELDVHATTEIRSVTAKDFQKFGGLSPVNDRALICKLLPGESLHFKAYIKMGTGKEHAKWNPVSMISFRQRDKTVPTFEFVMENLGKIPSQELINFALAKLRT